MSYEDKSVNDETEKQKNKGTFALLFGTCIINNLLFIVCYCLIDDHIFS